MSLPSLGKSWNGEYLVAIPGMLANTNTAFIRQSTNSESWLNTEDLEIPYGVGIKRTAAGVLALASGTGTFSGITRDPGGAIDKGYYAKGDAVNVLTFGDIWVRVPSDITIVADSDLAYLVTSPGATLGFLTNVANGDPVGKFMTGNHNGLAVVYIFPSPVSVAE